MQQGHQKGPEGGQDLRPHVPHLAGVLIEEDVPYPKGPVLHLPPGKEKLPKPPRVRLLGSQAGEGVARRAPYLPRPLVHHLPLHPHHLSAPGKGQERIRQIRGSPDPVGPHLPVPHHLPS
ncbi:hypothetical protein Thermus77927_16220 [Thermus hydrothermalis]